MTLENIRKEYLELVKTIKDEKKLYDLRVKFLGKKGALTEVMKGARDLSPEERPTFGKLVNEVKTFINDSLEERKAELAKAALELKLASEDIDITLPSKKVELGGINPLNKIIEEIEEIFISMGYSVAEGPEVETDKFNFEMLNLPKDHPARDMQDSFYITNELLIELGLVGGATSKILREQLCERINIGYTNAKQLLNKLNMYNISKDRLINEMKKISKGQK